MWPHGPGPELNVARVHEETALQKLPQIALSAAIFRERHAYHLPGDLLGWRTVPPTIRGDLPILALPSALVFTPVHLGLDHHVAHAKVLPEPGLGSAAQEGAIAERHVL